MLIFKRMLLPANLARIILLACSCVFSADLIAQQGDAGDGESAWSANVSAETAVASPVATLVSTPAMSSATVEEEQPEAGNQLLTQSGDIVMTAGTCLVIDDFVRQFCSANPGDISCQFQ